MDAQLQARVIALTAAAERFVAARKRGNPDLDWLTDAERSALSDIRFAVHDLEREEKKPRKGIAA